MDEQFVGVANQSFTMEQGKTKLMNVIKEFGGGIPPGRQLVLAGTTVT